MEFVDYYKVLGLTKQATEADIKKAYRRLARKYHPDLNPNDAGAKIKFQQVNEANEVLSDSAKRIKYDQYGKDWKAGDEASHRHQQNSGPNRQEWSSGGRGSTYQDFSEQDFSDFFQSMFGGEARGRQGSQVKYRGQDVSAELHLDLKDAYTTHKQTLNVNGKNIRLTIPAGVEDGQTIKIAGHGGAGKNGGPNGDLYITFIVTNSSRFKREGNNLTVDVELNLYTAVLGGEIMLDTFDGKVKLVVKPETQNGTRVKLKGKGFPVYKKEGEFGDLYVTWKIKIPTNLSEKEKELFRELAKHQSHEK
jgi:curved DNA-binding protein